MYRYHKQQAVVPYQIQILTYISLCLISCIEKISVSHAEFLGPALGYFMQGPSLSDVDINISRLGSYLG